MKAVTGNELAQLGRNLPDQFKLELEGGVLAVNHILRLLPGKRVTCQADYAGKTVVAKVFFGSGYRRHWLREVEGAGYITEAKIRTPDLLLSVENEAEGFAVALFEFIDQAETLESQWQKASDAQAKIKGFEQALEVIAALHNHSVFQKDIHLNNFLIKGEALYLIDGDQVFQEVCRQGLSPKLAVDNLAMFFTQFYPWQDEWIAPLFERYLSLREVMSSEVTLQVVQKKLQEHRAWREKKYIEKKVFRVCSEFDLIKNWQTFCIFSREIKERDARDFIDDPDAFVARGEILKNGRTATVAKIDFAGKPFILKRYNRKGYLHQAVRCLMQSKAAISWRNAHLLRFNGISTPAPLLLLEKRFGPMCGYSYLLTEYFEGVRGCDYFEHDDFSAEMKEVAGEIAILVQNLHRCHFSHGDLKSHNILIGTEGPTLIDLDGMKRVKSREEISVHDDWLRLYKDLGETGIASVLFDEAGL